MMVGTTGRPSQHQISKARDRFPVEGNHGLDRPFPPTPGEIVVSTIFHPGRGGAFLTLVVASIHQRLVSAKVG